ncbi:MAG TPA: hypothetical protein VG797_09765 [Phycisphaerales bacterium]|nr:hypothetical protein [Phycisphaerales bacterium]
MRRVAVTSIAVAAVVALAGAAQAAPQYNIIDLGVSPGGTASQGNRGSSNGVYATGRSLGGSNQAFSWTQGGGLLSLPNLASPARNFSVGNGVNNNGVIVGTGSTTSFGSSPLPLMWSGGVASQLPLPAGQTLGRANDINDLGVAVGSVNGGSLEVASLYAGGIGTTITATTSTGCFFRTAFSINNAGTVVGFGVDPNNAARNVGIIYDSESNTMTEVGALPGMNGALAFDVSENGFIVGSSMLNQGSGQPFIWSAGVMTQIPLPVGASQAGARGVNNSGWVVGTASSAFALPYLYDGVSTYLLGDLIPGGTGWNLTTNTSSSAMSISNDGVIIGTGILNGQVHAYAMIPVPTPGAIGLFATAGLSGLRRRRR